MIYLLQRYSNGVQKGNAMTHNELLKLARKKAGMSQAEFAGYFRMPVKTLRHWEINERKVPDYLLRLMLYKLEMEGYVSGLQEMVDTED